MSQVSPFRYYGGNAFRRGRSGGGMGGRGGSLAEGFQLGQGMAQPFVNELDRQDKNKLLQQMAIQKQAQALGMAKYKEDLIAQRLAADPLRQAQLNALQNKNGGGNDQVPIAGAVPYTPEEQAQAINDSRTQAGLPAMPTTTAMSMADQLRSAQINALNKKTGGVASPKVKVTAKYNPKTGQMEPDFAAEVDPTQVEATLDHLKQLNDKYYPAEDDEATTTARATYLKNKGDIAALESKVGSGHGGGFMGMFTNQGAIDDLKSQNAKLAAQYPSIARASGGAGPASAPSDDTGAPTESAPPAPGGNARALLNGGGYSAPLSVGGMTLSAPADVNAPLVPDMSDHALPAGGSPTPEAVDYLRQNPHLATAFDAKYGDGASKPFLDQTETSLSDNDLGMK